MIPIEPDEVPNGWDKVVYAKNQPEYLPLPVIKDPDGLVISRWKLSFRERIRIFLSGNLWLHLSTFNHPLQPIYLDTKPPKFVEAK